MQITLMQNNSSRNIIIKQTSENGIYFHALIYTQQSLCFHFLPFTLSRCRCHRIQSIFPSSAGNLIMKLRFFHFFFFLLHFFHFIVLLFHDYSVSMLAFQW